MNRVDLIKSTMYESRRSGIRRAFSPLFLISKAHGFVVAIRRSLYRVGLFKSRKIDAFVISVGNIVVGGSGKTPTVIYLAKLLKESGYKVCVLSRGYKGTNRAEYLEVSNEKEVLSDPVTAGDEPYMMARKLKGIPVIVGKNRYLSGARAVEKFKPDICILDDGFQHLKLKRDLDIVTFDGDIGFGNGDLIPAGILREQASALKRADIVLVNKGTDKFKEIALVAAKYDNGHNVFFCDYAIDGLTSSSGERKDIGTLMGKRVFVFSAIANPKTFHNMVEQASGVICGKIEFADHHSYNSDDFLKITECAKSSNASLVVTTEKDIVKLNKTWIDESAFSVFSLDVSLKPVENNEILRNQDGKE